MIMVIDASIDIDIDTDKIDEYKIVRIDRKGGADKIDRGDRIVTSHSTILAN